MDDDARKLLFFEKGGFKKSDDPFCWLRRVIDVVHYSKISRCFLTFSVLYHVIPNASLAYEIFATLNVNLLKQYGSALLLSFIGQVATVLVMNGIPPTHALMDDMMKHLCPINSSHFQNKKVQQRFLYYKIIISILYFYGFMTLVIAIPLSGLTKGYIYIEIVLIEHFPQYIVSIFMYILAITGTALSLMFSTGIFGFLHVFLYLWFQLSIMNNLVECLHYNFHDDEEYNRFHDQKFQKLNFEFLRVIVRRHIYYKRCFTMAKELFTIPFLFFASFAFLALFAFLLGLMADAHVILVVCFLCLSITNFIIGFSEGQRFTDEGASLHENMVKINWRCMDLRNRRLVLMMITNSAEDAIFGIPGILELNHPFATKIIKVGGSLVTFIHDINT